MKAKSLAFGMLLVLVISSSAFDYRFKAINDQVTADSVHFKVPANFPKPVYDFKDNPVTANGFNLGRKLFYDPILSRDKSISCANCHQSFAAFANLDHAVSHGVDECLGTRNAPPLFNLAWQKEFMWDGGVHHIEVSPLNALTNPCEMAGYALFKQHCSACHKEPLFTDLSYRSNGLDLIPDDIGRDSITRLASDKGKFRVPSLRNVELTSPYMHDGRFTTLKQVLQHYSTGVKPTTNLDPVLHQNAVPGIILTSTEQAQLIAFLKTLTDQDFVNDKRFQAPNQ